MSSSRFQVIPAIDIRGGCCVRLYQGDYQQETVFSDDPVAVAKDWQSQGATRLHVVDLDGARSGGGAQRSIVERLLASVKLPVQVGGGLRKPEDVASVLAAGADRAVLGTIALTDTEMVGHIVHTHGAERIVVALDARDGLVATQGWLDQSQISALDLAVRLKELGVIRILYTDISRDGTQEGPNVAAIRQVVEHTGLAVIASGGVSRPEHLTKLRDAGAEAVIVGRALYTGALTLKAARTAVCDLPPKNEGSGERPS